jgi:glycosyltransferase involved in cell wall biosynthesis
MELVLLMTGGEGFPTGGAYTNRVLSIAKGLVQNNNFVALLILYPGHNNTPEKEGVFDGIYFKFCTTTIRPKNTLKKKLIGIIGIINAIIILFTINKKKKPDSILSFSSSFLQNYSMFLATRLLKIPLIREKNEYPKSVIKKGFQGLSFFDNFYINNFYKIYDGYIFISHALVDFFREKTRKNSPITIVPITVDLQRFENANPKGIEKWITYCGNMYGDKDGVPILFEAYSQIHYKYPEHRLVIIGDTNNKPEFEKLRNKIKILGIDDKVIFTGYVHRDKMPEYLCRSMVLVLSRPNNVQAQAGFPTKLGEYLAAGRPVLVTSVGDIPKYITDKKNGYLAIPGNSVDFADRLNEILDDMTSANIVGMEGRKLAHNVFNSNYQAQQIVEFIQYVKFRKRQ